MKITQIVWKVCEECVRVSQGVSESVWKYHQWASKLKYMILDTQNVKIGKKLMKIAQSVWKVCEECVRVCGGVF